MTKTGEQIFSNYRELTKDFFVKSGLFSEKVLSDLLLYYKNNPDPINDIEESLEPADRNGLTLVKDISKEISQIVSGAVFVRKINTEFEKIFTDLEPEEQNQISKSPDQVKLVYREAIEEIFGIDFGTIFYNKIENKITQKLAAGELTPEEVTDVHIAFAEAITEIGRELILAFLEKEATF